MIEWDLGRVIQAEGPENANGNEYHMYKGRKKHLWSRTLPIRSKVLGNCIGEIGEDKMMIHGHQGQGEKFGFILNMVRSHRRSSSMRMAWS